MSENEQKKPKKKGPIRFEAIIPVTVLSAITFGYFSFYFDSHLKNLVEYVGTQGNGAEVNVGSIHTSFIKGSFDLNQLQVTDKEKPTHNLLEIQNIHFQYIWDALLRMKFVVEEASINNIQMLSPRKSPGKVLPPEPAKPSKMTAIQDQVMAQVKSKYNANMLGDVVTLLEGGDYQNQIQEIRETLKSETRIKSMISEVDEKKTYWDGKIKELSNPEKVKEVEAQIQTIGKQKNIIEQAQGVKKLGDLLKDVQKQYDEVKKASKQLETEISSVAQYPKEIENLVQEDIASLKGRFSIPKIDFKDMAMHLFAGEFAEYIAKGRKYQALAKQYIPEKKAVDESDVIVPRKRSDGKNYEFPVTKGYPLFWLKKAAISSTGTADTYSGNVSGVLANVTTSPKQIGIPLTLDVKGDFPAVKVSGVKANITIDHTKSIPKQTALIQVASFAVPEKLFVDDQKMKFGFQNAIGSTTIKAEFSDSNLSMVWQSALSKPQFVVETSSKIAKEILNNVLNTIPVININGNVTGSFENFDMNIESNLGDELSNGFKREIGLKVTEAQDKLKALVDEKINKPKQELMGKLGGNKNNLSDLNKAQDLFKKNEGKIKDEIAKLQKGGGSKDVENLKEQGKKFLKGFKL